MNTWIGMRFAKARIRKSHKIERIHMNSDILFESWDSHQKCGMRITGFAEFWF